MLLKTSESALCYTCHGTGSIGATTDVVDGMGYADKVTTHAGGPGALPAGSGALRGGGFEYALIATNTLAANPTGTPSNGSTLGRVQSIPVAATSSAATSAHSVDGSAVTMWGAGADGIGNTGKADVLLTCASCHDPHGNGQYRILKTAPDGIVANPNVAGVKVNDATVKSYTTTTAAGGYGINAQVAADAAESPLNADGSSLNYDFTTKMFSGTYLESSSRWCSQCHTRYLGFRGSAGNNLWTAAGSPDTTFTFRHATRNIVDPLQRGITASGTINPASPSSQLRPGSTLGSYTSSGVTYRGVAAYDATTSGLMSASDVGNGTTSITGQTGDRLSNSAPRCITCHVSHGSNAVAGDVVDLETSIVANQTGLGSTLLRLDGRSVCQACHAK
jgi:hypothetical protein